SFYIFHGISLIVDTRRGDYKISDLSQSHSWKTFLYIMFFPQLIAGPIVKARDFFPQIERKCLDKIDWSGSVRLLILGYFLKMVIADNLNAETQAIVYPQFLDYGSTRLISLLIGYSCQIFADFCG